MSDEDIIQRAIARNLSGERITDGEARVIASQWHAGQSSALYALASSGAILKDDLLRELYSEMITHDDRQSANRELAALERYVHIHGQRGPVTGWSAIWG